MDLNQTKNLSTDEEPKARWCHYPRPTRSGGRGKKRLRYASPRRGRVCGTPLTH